MFHLGGDIMNEVFIGREKELVDLEELYLRSFSIKKLQNVYNYAKIMYKEREGYFMPQIRPITDLRNTNDISDACHAVKEPIFITKNGYCDL